MGFSEAEAILGLFDRPRVMLRKLFIILNGFHLERGEEVLSSGCFTTWLSAWRTAIGEDAAEIDVAVLANGCGFRLSEPLRETSVEARGVRFCPLPCSFSDCSTSSTYT